MKTIHPTKFIAIVAMIFSLSVGAQDIAIYENNSQLPTGRVHNIEVEQSTYAQLEYCMPNPAHNSCAVRYMVPEESTLSQIIIQNALGEVVYVSESLPKGAGVHSIPVETLPNGNYYYSLTVDYAKIETRTVIVSH